MNTPFYVAAAVAVISTVLVITRSNPVHALLYLIVSLLAVALIFFLLGAPFVAALEVIIYAGAIMVLFMFVVMMLNLGPEAVKQEREWMRPGMWIGPGLLSLILLALLVPVLSQGVSPTTGKIPVDAKALGTSLFGPYIVAVQLAALLLLSAVIGTSHLRRRERIAGILPGLNAGHPPDSEGPGTKPKDEHEDEINGSWKGGVVP